RDYNTQRYSFTGPGDLGQFAESDSWANELVHGRRQGPWVDTQAVAQHKEDYPQYWTEDLNFRYVERLQNLMDFRETVTSLYWLGHAQLRNFGVLGGLRVEETRTEGNGSLYQLTDEEQARRTAWVGELTPDEIRRRAFAEWGTRTSARGEYRKVF